MNNQHQVSKLFNPIALIVLIVVVWRLALFFVANLAPQFLTYSPSFPYSDSLIKLSQLPAWVYSWANFDGVHYLTIINQGYFGTGLIQAFFPLYPTLIDMIITSYSMTRAIQSGLLLSVIAFLGASIVWWWAVPLFLAQKPKQTNSARWLSLFLLLLFPTSFYFGAFYTEALFFVLSISALALGIKRHFILASVLAGLASGTRLVGVFLVPGLLLEYWWPSIVLCWQKRQTKHSRFVVLDPASSKDSPQPRHTVPTQSGSASQNLNLNIKSIALSFAIIIIGSSGLLLYSGYLQKTFHDPLYFFSVQSQFGAGREQSIILYPQTAWRATKILLTARPFDWKYFAYTQEFLVGMIGLIGIIWSAKYVKPSIWLFSFLTFLLPTLTGTFSSMPRYFLTSYSVFLAMAVVLSTRRQLGLVLLLLSTIFLIINTMLFIQGYWVA